MAGKFLAPHPEIRFLTKNRILKTVEWWVAAKLLPTLPKLSTQNN
jgi:hypothetical protein